MAILIMLGNAAIGGAWIIAQRAARRRAMQAATGRRLADVLAEGQFAQYYTPVLSPDEIAELNAETWPD
jgi:hypothetical protein